METLRYRHEWKFICDENSLMLMENKIRHLCRLDPYVGPEGNYEIRSLYFDTYDDCCFQEGMDGTDNRKKYRIRIYDGCPEMIKLECKHSVRGMKAKEICRISKHQCESLIKGKPVSDVKDGQELLKRFLLEQRTELFTPKVMVEYTRTPYLFNIGNVRITFDRNICSGFGTEHFLEPTIERREIFLMGEQLLEVKFDEILPSFIVELLAAGQQMSRTSFSKYVLCRKYAMT